MRHTRQPFSVSGLSVLSRKPRSRRFCETVYPPWSRPRTCCTAVRREDRPDPQHLLDRLCRPELFATGEVRTQTPVPALLRVSVPRRRAAALIRRLPWLGQARYRAHQHRRRRRARPRGHSRAWCHRAHSLPNPASQSEYAEGLGPSAGRAHPEFGAVDELHRATSRAAPQPVQWGLTESAVRGRRAPRWRTIRRPESGRALARFESRRQHSCQFRDFVLQCRELGRNPGQALVVTGTASPATASVIHGQLLTSCPSPVFSEANPSHTARRRRRQVVGHSVERDAPRSDISSRYSRAAPSAA